MTTDRRSSFSGRAGEGRDPAHAPGKRKLGRPPVATTPHETQPSAPRHQPWVPTSGLVGRKRRSARRG